MSLASPAGLLENLVLSSAAQQAAVQIVRRNQIAKTVAFVGGLPACGKTMMTPIVGSFARVELQKFNYTLEYVCELRQLGKLDAGSASAFIRLLTDMDLYNLMMTRETNLRFSDTSSIFRNPGTWRYLRRLFQPGDAAAARRIEQERPILHLSLHNCLAISAALFEALGDSVRIVEVVRHPLYMLKQWRLYIERYAVDSREFTMAVDEGSGAVPFFAAGWAERYQNANPMDKCIYAIQTLLGMGQQVLDGVSAKQREQILVVPFERFVAAPESYLKQIERLLQTQMTRHTRRELRRQRVPRARVAAGRNIAIYKQYGWQPPEKGLTERQELNRRRDYAAQEASPQAMVVLDGLSEDYERRYWTEVRA